MCASLHSSTMFRAAARSGPSATIGASRTYSAAQDEITEAIIASIEPQIYAAENVHAKRKPPANMTAWGWVMRALSHFWQVTQEDNSLAQSMLEKALAIDPYYGQALGVMAASQTLGAYMGWADMHTTVPAAEGAALAAIRADTKTRGPTTPWLCVFADAAF